MKLSVIIPVFNDADGLSDTVDSLLAQDSPASGYEIIIADNGSTDETWRRAQKYADSHAQIVAVRENSIQGSYAARNRGIEAAGGAILCFVDADMTVPADYIDAVGAKFSDEELDYLACDVEITLAHSSLSATYNCLTGFPIERYLEKDHYAPTCCLCVRRSCVEKFGAFDDRLESGGDMEFGQRLFDNGVCQDFAPNIQLKHPARFTFDSLLSKQRRIGRGHAQLSHYFPGRYSLFLKLYVKTTRYFLPDNPFKLAAKLKQRDLDCSAFGIAGMAIFQIPLAWAGLFAYLDESQALRRRS